jgi:hypothetical protein
VTIFSSSHLVNDIEYENNKDARAHASLEWRCNLLVRKSEEGKCGKDRYFEFYLSILLSSNYQFQLPSSFLLKVQMFLSFTRNKTAFFR